MWGSCGGGVCGELAALFGGGVDEGVEGGKGRGVVAQQRGDIETTGGH